MIRWQLERESICEVSQDTREPPTLCEEYHGIFNDHSESGPHFNISSERLHVLICTALGHLGYFHQREDWPLLVHQPKRTRKSCQNE